MTPKVKVLDCSYLSAASDLSQVSQKQLKPPTGELDTACTSKVSESEFSFFLLLLPYGLTRVPAVMQGSLPTSSLLWRSLNYQMKETMGLGSNF